MLLLSQSENKLEAQRCYMIWILTRHLLILIDNECVLNIIRLLRMFNNVLSVHSITFFFPLSLALSLFLGDYPFLDTQSSKQ